MLKKMNLNFIIRTILFIALSIVVLYTCMICIVLTIGLLPILILGKICAIPEIIFNSENMDFFDSNCTVAYFILAGILIPYVLSPITCWLYAKTFGLFKELDKLNISKKQKYILLIVVAVLILIFLLLPLPYKTDTIIGGIIEANKYFGYIILALPLSYFLYTKANELTPKYKLLQKIGYICSSRFVKDTFKKAREKFCHGKKN